MGLTDFFVRDRNIKSEKEPEVKDTAGSAPSNPSAPPPLKIREKEEEGADLIDALLSGKEIITTLESKYGPFDFRFPAGGDQVAIAHRLADYQGGRPSAAFDSLRRYQFEMWATLDILITRKPERFAKMASWAEFPDQSLVEDLYNRGSLFCSEIRKKIRGDDGGQLARGGQAANS